MLEVSISWASTEVAEQLNPPTSASEVNFFKKKKKKKIARLKQKKKTRPVWRIRQPGIKDEGDWCHACCDFKQLFVIFKVRKP